MKIEIAKPQLVISPMAGVTDAAFRQIALKHGADYGVSEMLTSQTELWGSQKSQQRLKVLGHEPKRILQIAGASPEVIKSAAVSCSEMQADAIEINMGCPAKKVCKVLAGSALLRDEGLVAAILTAAVHAVTIPVYLKTRLGWDHSTKNILTIAKLAEDCGIQSLAIHGRTRNDMYNGEASFDLIAEVKQQAKIPVFANGDINTPEDAANVLNYTKADGLYIGRGALGRPWLFQQIREYLVTGKYDKSISKTMLKALVLEHVGLIHQHYGEYMGVRIARKHVKWYFAQNSVMFPDTGDLFTDFSQLDSPEAQLEHLTGLFDVYK